MSFNVKVFKNSSYKDMEKLGMGALLGVAKGTHEPPKFIVLEYRGGGKGAAPVVVVGKGVTNSSDATSE